MPSFPKTVQIQTMTRCNADCSICPYPEVKREIEHGIMSENLFQKIVSELGYMKPERILPYLMNEPLLDKRIFDFVDVAKKESPSSIIEVATNAANLDAEKRKRILSSEIDELNISFHALEKSLYEQIMPSLDFEKTLSNIKLLLEAAKNRKRPKIVIYSVRIQGLNDKEIPKIQDHFSRYNVDFYVEPYYDRAGNNTFRLQDIQCEIIRGCKVKRHETWMHILYNGDVVSCCMDWRREEILGNCRDQTLEEIWLGADYEMFRNKVDGACESRSDFICKRCMWAEGDK